MKEIDKKELKLLSILEEDARQSLSNMAKQMHTSQQLISYLLQSLEKRRVILGYYTLINLAKLGYTSYRTMLRLSNVDERKRKEIIDYLAKHKNILWLVEVGGRWDLLVNFMAKNIIHYSNILRKFRNKFSENIQNYDVLTTIEGIFFGREYLTKEKREIKKNLAFGGNQVDKMNIDQLNLTILRMIAEKGRINAVEIAEKVKVSPNTIVLRLKELRKKEIIQGVRPWISLDKIGYQGFKALVKFQNITEDKENEIIESLQEYINVTGVIRLVGLWDFEIEFEVKNQEEMLILTRRLRDLLKDVAKDFEILPLYREYVYNFLPKDILDTNL